MHTDSQHAPLAPPDWPANKCSCICFIRKSLNLTDVARNAREHQLLPFWSEPVACKQSGGRTRSVKRVTWCPKGKQVRPTIFTFHTDNKPLIIAVVQWVKSTQAHSVKGLLHPNYHKHFSYLATPAEKETVFFFSIRRDNVQIWSHFCSHSYEMEMNRIYSVVLSAFKNYGSTL